jgi:hypothetical protein
MHIFTLRGGRAPDPRTGSWVGFGAGLDAAAKMKPRTTGNRNPVIRLVVGRHTDWTVAISGVVINTQVDNNGSQIISKDFNQIEPV